MNADTQFVAFKAISSFINDLSDVFGEEQRSLKLYAHLISKTTDAHETAIAKHIQSFRAFCISNRESIETTDTKLKSNMIIYSDKVQIDMSDIFRTADGSTRKVIWRHLLIISALVDETGQARKILKESSDCESDFLSDIIEKIESNMDPSADPMSSFASIMSSGVFTDLIQGMGSGISDGSLNIESLIGGVQKIISKTSGDSGVDLSGMMNVMKSSGENGETPDISKLMGPLMNMIKPSSGGGEQPDISAMMASLSGQKGGGEQPDISAMMASLSGQKGGGEQPDISAMMASLMPPAE
jgi:hypothetical protein